MALYCENSSLINESDVEQKFIYQLLSHPHPLGLGFKPSDILTKHVLRQHKIGKGKTKLYYPDYLITIRGIPLLIVEAKAPDEDLDTAYDEARLYAAEVNAHFQHNVNVCNRIIVCNGSETWAGFSDHNSPEVKLLFDDFNVENITYASLLSFCSRDILLKDANQPYINARGKAKFVPPVWKLGGKRAQDEELIANSYGQTLIFEYSGIFDPKTEIERTEIVKNAYVPSKKREQHSDPMYKEIKKIKLPSEINSVLVSTDNPKEIVNKVNSHIEHTDDNYSLMILIGSVGSGKSTFVRYFKNVVIDRDYKDISAKGEWIFLDLNPAPINKDEIYKWVRSLIIEVISSNHPKIDFEEHQVIMKVFKKEIKEFSNGLGMIIKDTPLYNQELFNMLKEHLLDKEIVLKARLRFLKEDLKMLPIIVLDNCDKRNKDEQLLMFEVAQWIKDNYKCLVILPMRDSTYDNYKTEPPLDTVVKDLVFRIDPPDLLTVLQKRLDYIYRIREEKGSKYVLDSGMSVVIKKDEHMEYFACMLLAIRNNKLAKYIFYSLMNRDIRSGIQLFEDICRSGHIKVEDIFRIRTSSEYQMPEHDLMNALLRRNRKYYDDEKSNFANLFSASNSDDFPDPFIRTDILLYLKGKFTDEGPSGVKGYHSVESVVNALQIIGHNENVILREIIQLVKRGLIYSESQLNMVEKNDLTKISPSGILHLRLLTNISYLEACAENVIYKYSNVMTRIARILASDTYLEEVPMIIIAKEMIEYLKSYREEYTVNPVAYLKDECQFCIYDLNASSNEIRRIIERNSVAKKLITEIEKYPSGCEIDCRIVNKQFNNLLCIYEKDLRGFLSTKDSKFKLTNLIYDSLNTGDRIKCRVIHYDYEHNSMQLEYIRNYLDE